VPAAIQHDAVHILRLQRRLSLREQKRQVRVAVDDGAAADDASQRRRVDAIHQPLCRLRFHRQRNCRSQPDDQRAAVSTRMARPVDWLQLCYGEGDGVWFVSLVPCAWFTRMQITTEVYNHYACFFFCNSLSWKKEKNCSSTVKG
jgi:hypothetical protein